LAGQHLYDYGERGIYYRKRQLGFGDMRVVRGRVQYVAKLYSGRLRGCEWNMRLYREFRDADAKRRLYERGGQYRYVRNLCGMGRL